MWFFNVNSQNSFIYITLFTHFWAHNPTPAPKPTIDLWAEYAIAVSVPCKDFLCAAICAQSAITLCIFFNIQSFHRCSNESKHLYKTIYIFLNCMQTIKLRQTSKNNGGPFTSKSDAKCVPWASKSNAKTVLTKLQYVTSWKWAWVGEKDIFQMIFVLHRWKRKSYMFKMTWEWVKDDTVFILGEISL